MSNASEQSAAFDRARIACDEAIATAGEHLVVRDFIFGGKRVRMRSAGRELEFQLTRPFLHLVVPTDLSIAPSLTMDVWDERRVHVPYPSEGDFDPTEARWACGQGTMSVSQKTRYVRYDCDSWVTWMDRANSRIIGWRASAERLSMHERTRPLPFLLPVWYADQQVHIIHAGLVAHNNKGVLFCGHNGAGKSTTSIACMTAGLDFLSDDHVGLQFDKDTFIGHSVFASTRLEPDHLEKSFPSLIPHSIKSTEWWETKSLVLVAEAMPERVKRSTPIRALIAPKIVDAEESRITKVSRAEAMRALAPSTLMQMPFGATSDRFLKMGELALKVPAFRLELGRDISTIGPRVMELIDQLA